MVRAGVVKHPGYNEIQQPKRKKILINYDRLKELLGFNSYEHVKTAHKQWVERSLSKCNIPISPILGRKRAK